MKYARVVYLVVKMALEWSDVVGTLKFPASWCIQSRSALLSDIETRIANPGRLSRPLEHWYCSRLETQMRDLCYFVGRPPTGLFNRLDAFG